MGGSGHDFSTCIFQDTKLISMIEDERVLRKKHSFFSGMGKALLKMPAYNYCLEETNLTIEDMDYIVANSSLENYYYIRNKRKDEIVFINHHLSHACSAFYPSDFDNAAILVIDGGGLSDEEGMTDSTSLWVGNGNKIEPIVIHGGKTLNRKAYNEVIDIAENSLGIFYHVVTHVCGFGALEEGKTMGLAPYGTDKYYKRIRSLVDYGPEGSFICPLESLDELLVIKEEMNQNSFEERADIAWAGQKIVEEAVIHSATYLKSMTNCENICIAGGVALNSVANYKLYKTGMFKNYFIQPAAGDNGTSIGAAYYGAYVLGGLKR